jgi:hypothetical protein
MRPWARVIANEAELPISRTKQQPSSNLTYYRPVRLVQEYCMQAIDQSTAADSPWAHVLGLMCKGIAHVRVPGPRCSSSLNYAKTAIPSSSNPRLLLYPPPTLCAVKTISRRSALATLFAIAEIQPRRKDTTNRHNIAKSGGFSKPLFLCLGKPYPVPGRLLSLDRGLSSPTASVGSGSGCAMKHRPDTSVPGDAQILGDPEKDLRRLDSNVGFDKVG